MANVKTCSVCRHKNDPREFFCASERDGKLCGSPLPDEEDSVPDVALMHTEDDRKCPCLEFPWGTVDITEDLEIGRDSNFSRIADSLNEFVSRRHATLFNRDGALYVKPLASTNPTYVNGSPIEAGSEVQLVDGDLVSFSRHMTAKVCML